MHFDIFLDLSFDLVSSSKGLFDRESVPALFLIAGYLIAEKEIERETERERERRQASETKRNTYVKFRS